MSPEDVLKNMADNVFPKQEELKDKPLSVWEKAKLFMYRQVFKTDKPGKPSTTDSPLKAALKKIYKDEDRWKSMQQNYENLEERNKKHLDKLLDLLKKNPDEALKYAIPLDEQNTTRGGLNPRGGFEFAQRWLNFSLFSEQSGRTTSGSIDLG